MEKAWMRILIWVSQGTLARGEESCGLGLLGAARWRRWEVVCRGEGLRTRNDFELENYRIRTRQ